MCPHLTSPLVSLHRLVRKWTVKCEAGQEPPCSLLCSLVVGGWPESPPDLWRFPACCVGAQGCHSQHQTEEPSHWGAGQVTRQQFTTSFLLIDEYCDDGECVEEGNPCYLLCCGLIDALLCSLHLLLSLIGRTDDTTNQHQSAIGCILQPTASLGPRTVRSATIGKFQPHIKFWGLRLQVERLKSQVSSFFTENSQLNSWRRGVKRLARLADNQSWALQGKWEIRETYQGK